MVAWCSGALVFIFNAMFYICICKFLLYLYFQMWQHQLAAVRSLVGRCSVGFVKVSLSPSLGSHHPSHTQTLAHHHPFLLDFHRPLDHHHPGILVSLVEVSSSFGSHWRITPPISMYLLPPWQTLASSVITLSCTNSHRPLVLNLILIALY